MVTPKGEAGGSGSRARSIYCNRDGEERAGKDEEGARNETRPGVERFETAREML